MTAIDALLAALDANPADATLRLVLADALQEDGDESAEGYRALAAGRLRPVGGAWWNAARENIFSEDAGDPDEMPGDWFALLPRSTRSTSFVVDMPDRCREFRSRREAEDAAAGAFARLPAPRRAELLTPAPEVT